MFPNKDLSTRTVPPENNLKISPIRPNYRNATRKQKTAENSVLKFLNGNTISQFELIISYKNGILIDLFMVNTNPTLTFLCPFL